MSLEDQELDHLWRARFGQPLPMLGCAEIVRTILAKYASGETGEAPRPN